MKVTTRITSTPTVIDLAVICITPYGKSTNLGGVLFPFSSVEDKYPLDVPVLIQASGWPLYRLLRSFGVLEDLMIFNAQDQWRQGSLRRRLLDGAYERHVTARWARFVAFLESRGLPLVVWEPMGREPIFDAYRDHPLVSFITWEELPGSQGAPASEPGDSPRPWWQTEGLYVENDGHPTPLANRRFAEGLASSILSCTKEPHPPGGPEAPGM